MVSLDSPHRPFSTTCARSVPPVSPDLRAIALPFALPCLFRRARTSLVHRRRGMGWKRLRLDHITHRGIAFQPALVHPGQHRNVVVHLIVDLHESFVVAKTVQPAYILPFQEIGMARKILSRRAPSNPSPM